MSLTVKQWRRAKDITQEQMAKELGVHVNTYQSWEEAPEKISIEKAVQIANIFNVPFDEVSFKKEES